MKKLALLASVFLVGCGAGAVIQTAPDTYSVRAGGAGFSTDGVKADVYEAANAFCAKHRREMVEVSLKTQEGAAGRNPPSADLKFRCLPRGDIEIQQRRAGVQLIQNVSQQPVGQVDKFEQLKKLKELLDSGVLTQKEFEEQKAKLLSQ